MNRGPAVLRAGSGERPSVGVVIPCHNYGRFLPDAIDSVLRQTVRPRKVVVVDDGSTDCTQDSVQPYAGQVEYVYQPRRGANAARNRGLSAVDDLDYVVFLDADDRLLPTYIDRCLKEVEAGRGDFVYTQVRHFGQSDWVSSYPAWSLERLLESNYVHISALLPVATLREVGYHEGNKSGGMDWDLYLTLAGRGLRGSLVDEPLLEYRQHEGSIRMRLWSRRYQRHLIAARMVWRHRALYGASRAYGRIASEIWAAARELLMAQIKWARRLKARLLEHQGAR